MDDERSTKGPDGVRISGAQEARRIVAQPPTWADDEVDHDDEDVPNAEVQTDPSGDPSGDWMQAGDHTLSGVLGHAGQVTDSGDHGDHADGWGEDEGSKAPAASPAARTGLRFDPDTAGEASPTGGASAPDDDRFPDEMYNDPPPRRKAASGAGPAPKSEWSDTSGAAERIVAIGATDEPDDGWGSFAGGGPRWRREASDWADVDGSDASALADSGTQVGALDPHRSDQSDLYSFDEPGQRGTAPSDAGKGQGPAASSAKAGAKAGDNVKAKVAARRATKAKAAPPATLGVRVATGVTLAAVLGLILYVGKRPAAAVLVAAAVALAALELLTALRQRGFKPAIPAVLVGLVAMVAATYRSGDSGVTIVAVISVLTIMLWYLLGAERDRPVVNIAVSLLVFGYTAMAASSAALLLRPRDGVGLLFAAIACTVGYDVVGYFAGSFLGRNKLAPEISPNKTVEGLAGGMLGAVLVGAVVFGKITWHPWTTLAHGAMVGLVVAVAAPLGDLVESMMKRDLGMKDMGTLLPGHGGVLDRIDSMLFSVPAVFLLARLLRLA